MQSVQVAHGLLMSSAGNLSMASPLAKVPHLVEPTSIDQYPWMVTFVTGVVASIALGLLAKRIPGIAGANTVIQALTLLAFAATMSTLLDVPFFGSLADRFGELVDSWATALSATYNIGTGIIATIILIFLGLRYRNGREGSEDGSVSERKPESLSAAMLFGFAAAVVGGLVPWIGNALEFFRFSVLSGVGNVVITTLGEAGNWQLVRSTVRAAVTPR